MKTSAPTSNARALIDPKETLELSPAWGRRLEKRLSPRPSEFLPLGLCLERALANMHVEYAAMQVELLWGAPSQPRAELASDEPPTNGLLNSAAVRPPPTHPTR
jgi:hypothetical protein